MTSIDREHPDLADASCRKCGYLLRGLTQDVCPECGTAFDPASKRTFARSLHRARLRRVLRWAAAGGMAILLFVGIGPRGVQVVDIKMACQDCGSELCIRHWGLRLPTYIPLVPGFTTEDMNLIGPRRVNLNAATHTHVWDKFSLGVTDEWSMRIWRGYESSRSDGLPCTIGGRPLNEQELRRALADGILNPDSIRQTVLP